MHPYACQLLQDSSEAYIQTSLFGDKPMLRYVVKLHYSTRLHFDFRLELCGRLFSFAISNVRDCWSSGADAARVGDHDPAYIFGEQRIPDGEYGAGPMLVWDHGLYRSAGGTQEDIYHQLQNGCLEVSLQGVRLSGRFRISARHGNWRIERLEGLIPSKDFRSVLTGRSLDEIGATFPKRDEPFLLWLDWEQYYADAQPGAQVIVQNGLVYDLNFAAKTKGVAPGMRLQHVLPLVPNCEVRQLTQDPKRQERWLRQLIRYSDVIQPVEPHRAVLDLSAHPDPADIAGRIITRLTSKPLGFLKYGVGQAVWIAQLATQLRDPYGFISNPADRLAPLIVEHLLAVTQEERERLKALGLHTIGAVREVDFVTLQAQFGESAYQISSAIQGKTRDQVSPLFPPKSAVRSIWFESPVDDSIALENALMTLAEQLAEKITGQQAGVVSLSVESEEGHERTVRRQFKRPVHTKQSIQAFLAYLLGELQKEYKEVVRMTARLDRLEPLKSHQQELFVAASRSELQTALTSLKSSLGDQSVVLGSEIKIPRREQVLKAWGHATGWH
jgi:DNA ligase D-like protein (predicted 3'-phosphoesterase)